MPIVALFWGVLDGEVFDLFQGFAALLILVGVYLANKKSIKKDRI
jgi:drug/metabolite transporter (DMT)-like permease